MAPRGWRKIYHRILGLRLRLKKKIYQWRMRSALQRDIAAKRLAAAEKKVDKERAEERRVVVEEAPVVADQVAAALGKAAEKGGRGRDEEAEERQSAEAHQRGSVEQTATTEQAVKERRRARGPAGPGPHGAQRKGQGLRPEGNVAQVLGRGGVQQALRNEP